MKNGISFALSLLLSFAVTVSAGNDAFARKAKYKTKHKQQTQRAQTTRSTAPSANTTRDTTPESTDTAGGDNGESSSTITPVITPPSTFVDLTTARFGKLEVTLREASFLEAAVGDVHLSADNMDMNKGTLDSLSIEVQKGQFQEFTIDGLKMFTAGTLNFDVPQLLNNKVLQFREPAKAHVQVSVSQNSLNQFLNAPRILDRLSGSAKKRVPILSTLARQDVNFGFSFLKGDVKLEPENRIHLAMDSKLGMGKVGMPMTLSAEAQLQLSEGWVKLAETHLVTGGQKVPHDYSAKFVERLNSLSKWGTQSDDIKFEFTDLKVVPEDHLEMEGTAIINRLRFARNQEQNAAAESDKIRSSEPVPTTTTTTTTEQAGN